MVTTSLRERSSSPYASATCPLGPIVSSACSRPLGELRGASLHLCDRLARRIFLE
jgi:hypothetical protein